MHLAVVLGNKSHADGKESTSKWKTTPHADVFFPQLNNNNNKDKVLILIKISLH